MVRRHWLSTAAAALLVAGCATSPKPVAVGPPSPPPPAAEAPLPPPPPPAPPSWEDMAPAPGDWRFVAAPAAQAEYGEAGAPSFTLRCEAARQRIVLVRTGAAPGSALTLRTTFGSRQLAIGEGGAAAVAASDPILDDLVSSRGRIAVEAPGLPVLVLPTWPEPARVIEECRP
jgi:hypothetical protein